MSPSPGLIILTIAAASMMIVSIPVGILVCRVTSAWRHSTSSDFFLGRTQFHQIRQRWRTTLVFVFKKLVEIPVPGLTGDIQSCKQCTIALEGGNLLACIGGFGGRCTEEVKLVFLNGIIQRLRSLNQAVLRKDIALLFTNCSYFATCCQCLRTWHEWKVR